MHGRLHDRIHLVIGASRGIGRAVALALASEGATVIATARTLEALDGLESDVQVAGGTFMGVALELADLHRIHELGDVIGTRYGRLDAVFGSAGIAGGHGPVQTLSDAIWNTTLLVNLSSSFCLIRTFDPLLRQSDAGRLLFVTSDVAWRRPAGSAPDAVSKAALEALVGAYAHENQDGPIRANLINPGPIRAEPRADDRPDEDPSSAPTADTVAPSIVRMLSPDFTENGVIYDVVGNRLTRPVAPQGI